MKNVFTYIGLLFCLIPNIGFGQYLDSLAIKEVSIFAIRYRIFNSGQKLFSPDSIAFKNSGAQSISTFLADNSQIFIKNYGPGNIATPSFRGTGAEHTAILWNGFNLQSPMLGQIDLSLLPINTVDELQIKYGGNGALYGSGAIGGAIHLNSKPKYQSGLHAQLGMYAGSFGLSRQNFSLGFGTKKYFSKLIIGNQVATNNYPFYNQYLIGKPLMNQTHTANNQQLIISENYFKINPFNEINFRVWYQQTYRNIPPSMSSLISSANQTDKSLRITSEWRNSKSLNHLVFRTAYLYDYLLFEDKPKSIYSLGKSYSSISELEKFWILNPIITVSVAGNLTINKVETEVYRNKQNSRLAQLSSFKYTSKNKKIIGVFNARFELFNGKFIPITPSLGASYQPFHGFMLSANLNKTYRVPTFNELYWKPGGNPLLIPESGWGEEISLEYQLPFKKVQSKFTTTLFNRNTNNWIQWIPDSTFWRPQNVSTVWNRGLEIMCRNQIPLFAKSFIIHQSMFSFVQSTTSKQGKEYQLTYIPRITQQHLLTWVYRKYFISYTHTYTGMRFITSDNKSTMNDFQIGNLRSGLNFIYKKHACALNIEVNNCWNVSYQIIPDKPLPMRNYLLGINISI